MPIVKIKRFSNATKVELTVDESIIEVGGGITYLNRSMIVASIKATQNYAFHEAQAVACKLYESGGKIYAKFNRASTGVYNLVDINFAVTELDSTCTVEHKTIIMPKNTNSITDSITTVNRTKAFIIHTVKSNEVSSAIPMSNLLVAAKINSNNQVTFTRGISSSAALTIEYQIVYIPDIISVQNIEGTNTSNPTNATISKVETERTACFSSFYTPTGISYVQAQDYCSCYLTSSTNLRIEAYNPSFQMRYICQVVWFEFGRTINNNTTVAANSASANASFGETLQIDKLFEMMPSQYNTFAGAHSTTENAGHYLYAMKSLTTTQMTVERKDDYNAPESNVRTTVIVFDRGVTPRIMGYFHRMRKIMELRKSTQTTVEIGPFLDETNGKDEMNSLTLSASDFTLSKFGGAEAAPTLVGSISFKAKGTYSLTFAVSDLDTLGHMQLKIHKAGCVYAWWDFMVLSQSYYDVKYGTSIHDVNVTQVGGASQDLPTATNMAIIDTVVDRIETKTDTIDGIVDALTTDLATANDNILTIDTVVDDITTELAKVVVKLPSGTISDFSFNTQLEGLAFGTITSMLLAMANGNFTIDTNSGNITFYRQDNTTPIVVMHVTQTTRTRVSLPS